MTWTLVAQIVVLVAVTGFILESLIRSIIIVRHQAHAQFNRKTEDQSNG